MNEGMFDIVWLLNSSIDVYLKMLVSIVILRYLCKPKEKCDVGDIKKLDK
tara:strand:+ start:1008 stop:1157 length:150 start_codon:yes stop_codon:yes gene_type:complete